MDVTVIIATYNRSGALRNAIRGLLAQSVPAGFTWELLVVDNNSSDDTRAVVESFASSSPPVRYLFERRQGKSFALNTALSAATGDLLAFTDDDVTFDPSWLARLAGGLRAQDCAGVGGRIVAVWGTEQPAWFESEGPYRLTAPIVSLDLGEQPLDFTDIIPFGANLAIRRTVFERFGGFRTDLGPSAGGEIRGEDSEFCRRLMTAGERLVYVPDAVVYHPVEPRRGARQYFERWYYDAGRAKVRIEGIPGKAASWFGVPRFLVRTVLERFVAWVTTLEPKRRFYYKVRLQLALGQVHEAWLMRR